MENEINDDILLSTKMYGKTETEIKGLLFDEVDGVMKRKEDYATIVLSLNEAKQKRIKDKETELFNDGYKKAQKETLTKLEKELRDAEILSENENYSVLKDKFNELRNNTSNNTMQTADDLKKNPLFLEYEEKIKKEYIPLKQHEEKLSEFQNKIMQIEAKEKNIFISNEIIKRIELEKYKLSDNQDRRSKQVDKIVEDVKTKFNEFESVNNNIVLIKDGKVMEDEHGNKISLQNIIDNVALSLFDPSEPSKKTSAANVNTTKSTNNTNKKYYFKGTTMNQLVAERNKFQSEATTAEDKATIGRLMLEQKKALGL